MRLRPSVWPAVLSLFALARVALGACDPSVEPDRSDVANARAAIAAACDCTTAASHGAFVHCAVQQASAVLVNPSCAGAVKRCAARSTCGKPGFVTCCRTRSAGRTTCAVKQGATKCRAPAGGTACVGAFASCCDACDSGGCVATTTSTSSTSTSPSSTTTSTFPPPCGFDASGVCGGLCPSIFDVCVQDPVTSMCVCVEGPCGFHSSSPLSCHGTCPPPAGCILNAINGCGCIVGCGSCDPACVFPQICIDDPSGSGCHCAG